MSKQKPASGKSCEERFQLGGNAAAVLAEVHVLDREPAPEGPTQVEVDLGVGMHHDRAHPGRKLVEERVPAERVDPLGMTFDPHLHQAMDRTETTEKDEGTILQVFQPGYVFHGRVLRPAMVRVAVHPSAASKTAN